MLPSQTARPSSSRSHMYRRPRKRRLPIVLGMLTIVIGGGVVFKWWTGKGDPAPAEGAMPAVNPTVVAPPPAKSTTSATNSAALDTKAWSTPNLASKPNPPVVARETPKPVEKISMGAAVPSTASSNMPAVALNSPAVPESKPADLTPKTHTPPPSPPPSLPPATNLRTPAATTTLVAQRMQAGLDMLAQNKPVEARSMLTAALERTDISPADADRIRTELTKLNQRLIFGPEVVAGDPHVSTYNIQEGDSLVKLQRKLGLSVDWRFLQRVNNISAPERLRLGQRLKIVKGPFHAVIYKRDFRMDLFMGDGSDRVFVRSFKVGLGEHGATPEGAFAVKPNSKLIDPAWTNPRTGEQFAANDPKNPLGEYWIGLIGVSENIRDLETYGMHGTIEPDSIGQNRSMGCVRMLADDIALVYEVMIEGASRVEIRGDDFP